MQHNTNCGANGAGNKRASGRAGRAGEGKHNKGANHFCNAKQRRQRFARQRGERNAPGDGSCITHTRGCTTHLGACTLLSQRARRTRRTRRGLSPHYYINNNINATIKQHKTITCKRNQNNTSNRTLTITRLDVNYDYEHSIHKNGTNNSNKGDRNSRNNNGAESATHTTSIRTLTPLI